MKLVHSNRHTHTARFTSAAAVHDIACKQTHTLTEKKHAYTVCVAKLSSAAVERGGNGDAFCRGGSIAEHNASEQSTER